MNWFEQLKQNTKGVTVTKFKTFEGGGEFGPKGGFEATFVLNGTQIAEVKDDNWGGPLQIRATPEYYALAAEYVAAKGEDEYEKGSAFAYFLVEAHETTKSFVRKCKTKIIALDERCTDGKFFTYNIAYTPDMAAKLRIRDGADMYIVNEHV